MTPKEKAAEILKYEIYYWGDKGLETTQRCAIHAANIRSELMANGSSEETLEYWHQVVLEIYNQR